MVEGREAAVPAIERAAGAGVTGKDTWGQQQSARAQRLVLIIDDDVGVCAVLQRMLARLGYEAAMAMSGDDGLEIINRHAAHIAGIFLDFSLPQISGERLFYALRQLVPRVPVIVMSGYSEEELVARFTGERPTEFLAKPFALDDVRRKAQVIEN